MPNEDKIDPKIQELISEFKEQRDSLKKLINDIADSGSAIASVSAKIESAAQRLL